MKIYVVFKGHYSDRHVVGVCSTEELAERLAVLTTDQWDASDWEAYEVDEIPECPVGLLPHSVVMDRRGGVKSCGRDSVVRFKPDTEYYGVDNLMSFSMWAEDKEQAVKIANERRTQLIAMNIWLPHKVDIVALARSKGASEEELKEAEREAKYYFPSLPGEEFIRALAQKFPEEEEDEDLQNM